MKGSFFILLAICASLSLCHATSARKVLSSAAVREATLSGRCMTLTDETALTGDDGSLANGVNTLQRLRSEYVKYNTKKSMYRDGDVLAVYELSAPYQSLAGCANACLLDWRMDSSDNQTQTTPAYDATDSPWSPSTTAIEPIRECEYFNFNIDTGKCTLISGQTSTQLTSSDNYWSGKLICTDLDNIQDWAEQVVADPES
ncbi:hypothetical protein PSENEW3n2_00003870 [Picochlorum sp. SENEW3]|nr:hypothetical protein PSENEW3n2_00003870 [Picochlorum sp. SENEW3]WPT18570.1 hypothetical protein PSENEW3_00003870 [Picochlorum sp. SENEW3]